MNKIEKIVELVIEVDDIEDDGLGVDVISLVAEPAIEVDFQYFNKNEEFESYNDYPESVSNNAKRALKWVEEHGWGSCGEATGKKRANQLANKEKITRDTIARMASFKRHQQHKDVPYSEGCGGLMWDAWGGTSGIEWAINKLKKLEKMDECDGECEIFELSEEAQDAIIDYATNNGDNISENDIFINFEGFTFTDVAGEVGEQGSLLKSIIATIRDRIKKLGPNKINEEAKTYYRYTGPSAERKFCKAMMNLSKAGRIFTEQQIDKMNSINSQFAPRGRSSYSIFRYNGGVNCKHYWQKLKVFNSESGQRIIMTADPENSKELDAAKTQNKSRPSPNGSIDNNAKLNFSIDKDKKVVVGPVMIPNKFIIRKSEDGTPYYVYFTRATITKMAEKFIKLNNQNKTDLNHDGNIMTNNTLLETWIKEDDVHDKSIKYGFDLPNGTWFVSYKLSDETWELVKNEKIKGFSLAGGFIEKLSNNKKDNDLLNNIKNILKNVED